MAGLKEIRRRLLSVNNTRKITYAMKLVSAAKLNKAEGAVKNARKYTEAITGLLAELGKQQAASFTHPLMEVREQVKKVRVLVIGGSRGLCGGYNANVNRKIEAFLSEKSSEQLEIEWVLVGKKPVDYFRRTRRTSIKAFDQLPDNIERWPINELCTELETDYQNGNVDEVYLLYTKFRSAISVKAQVEKLLPLAPQAASETEAVSSVSIKTIFEPSAEAVFSAIVPVILRCRVRQAALDAKTSEFGSRMTAMDNATRNADDLSSRLQLLHNKLRQGGITSELLDIIGGAEALK